MEGAVSFPSCPCIPEGLWFKILRWFYKRQANKALMELLLCAFDLQLPLYMVILSLFLSFNFKAPLIVYHVAHTLILFMQYLV